MREFKFRAWNPKLKKMEQLDYLNVSAADFCGRFKESPPQDLFDCATVRGSMWQLDEVEVMQYTGLKDKNDVEIYEGDIVKIKHYHDARKYINGFIKYERGSFLVDYVDMESIISCEMKSIEVIGNVHENPKLLEVPDE